MSSVDKALQTQIENIEAQTGKSLDQLISLIQKSQLTKHGELRDMVKQEFGLGHGYANTLVHLAKQASEEAQAGPSSPEELIDAIYSGKKAELRPLHDAVMAMTKSLGQFEVAPKKAYVSLRRKKQFATIGPGSQGRLEVGLNMRDLAATDRLEELPPGKMCQYRVYLSDTTDVDEELLGWIETAFNSAG